MSNQEYLKLFQDGYFQFFENCYLRVSQTYKKVCQQYKVYRIYKIFFYVKIDKDFHLVFTGDMELSARHIRMRYIHYELESDLSINRFPDIFYSVAPHLFLNVTNFEKFLNSLKIAFRSYKKHDFV